MLLQFAFGEELADVGRHALPDSGNFQKGLVVLVDIGQLYVQAFNSFSSAAVGADAKRVVIPHLHQVGSFVEDVGNGFVVEAHERILAIGSWQMAVGSKSEAFSNLKEAFSDQHSAFSLLPFFRIIT